MHEFRADLHIHSRFSRATSSRLNIPLLAAWAGIKGIDVLGTGDFTHPVWRVELADQLVFDDKTGLLRPKYPAAIRDIMPEWMDWKGLSGEHVPSFMLQGEISSIYKKDGKVRKVHNLVYMPDFSAAEKFCTKLGETGNLKSDGRPIIGLDSRNLLEMVLDADPRAFLVPAHIWTPWFSLFGSKSGFDRLEDCFGDLSEHIFALETGLSSDPAMNRTISALDRYRMVSNSDAHSGENLAREANIFTGEVSYDGIVTALKNEPGLTTFKGTLEFFPDEGKYHLDGHRACNISLEPQETRKLGGICPVCGKTLTIGVLNRVLELADRAEPCQIEGESFESLIPLSEMLGEVLGVGSKSRKVTTMYSSLVRKFGAELDILRIIPVDELARFYAPLGEAVQRMRRGEVVREGGYDGEFGVIRVFTKSEQLEFTRGNTLVRIPETPLTQATLAGFPMPEKKNIKKRQKKDKSSKADPDPIQEKSKNVTDAAGADTDFIFHAPDERPSSSDLPRGIDVGAVIKIASEARAGNKSTTGLNQEQEKAVMSGPAPVLVLAGPGSGKTRTLIARIKHLIEEGISPRNILALTFTRRAASEMDRRLENSLGIGAILPRTDTLHALAFEHWLKAYGQNPVLLSDESAQRVFGEANSGVTPAILRTAWQSIARSRERLEPVHEDYVHFHERYIVQKNSWNLVDYTDLLDFWLEETKSGKYKCHWTQIMVDEIQDLSPLQLTLVKNLLPTTGDGFFGIGDPEQSIYGFRGAHGKVEEFLRMYWPSLVNMSLKDNYRSSEKIVNVATSLLNNHASSKEQADSNGKNISGICEMRAALNIPGEVHLFEGTSAEAEGTWVAGHIRSMLGAGSHTLEDSRKKTGELAGEMFSPGDIAILFRARSFMGPIKRALERAGIPFKEPMADAFWSDARVGRILDAAGRMLGLGGNVFEESTQDPLHNHKTMLKNSASLPCPERILLSGPLGIAAYFQNASPFDTAFWKSEHFKGLVKAFDIHKDWHGVINWINLQNELELVRAKSEKVQLMTLHASKGLEFKMVFLPALEDGIMPFVGPSLLSGTPERIHTDIDEELRLFYVGITRAMQGLFLSRASKRFLYGRELRLKPSRFLSKIPVISMERETVLPNHGKVEKQLKLF